MQNPHTYLAAPQTNSGLPGWAIQPGQNQKPTDQAALPHPRRWKMVESKSQSSEMEATHAASLIQRIAQNQDRLAFTSLFAHYAPRIKRYLLGVKAKPGEAEETAQEVMLIVWRKAWQFDPERASPTTWIFTITRNRFVDLKRKQARPIADMNDPSQSPSQPQSPEEQTGQNQTQTAVQKALSELPENQAQIIRLAFLSGLSHMEISTQLELPLGTVKSRIRLAFNRLGPLLEHLQ